MGYRSEVCVAVNDNVQELLNIVRKVDKNLDELLSDADTDTARNCNKYHWSDIKWYEGYEEIDAFTKLLNQVEYSDWAMLKIGEDLEDIVVTGDTWAYDIYVQRSIQW